MDDEVKPNSAQGGIMDHKFEATALQKIALVSEKATPHRRMTFGTNSLIRIADMKSTKLYVRRKEGWQALCRTF